MMANTSPARPAHCDVKASASSSRLWFDRRTERKARDADDEARRDSLFAQDIPNWSDYCLNLPFLSE